MQRLATGALSEVLDQVGAAIAAGCVNVISVEAIRVRSGDRWARKREQVETFVERTFSRGAQPGDLIAGLNDAEFLIVQPSAARVTATGVSAKLLKETLEFFLGAAAREDLKLFEVTAFENGELSVRSVEPGHALDAHAGATAAGPRRAAIPPTDALGRGRAKTVRLVSTDGAPLDLRLSAEPTWNAARRVVASYLLQSEITACRAEGASRRYALAELSPNLAADVLLAALQYAGELLNDGGAVGVHAPLALSAIVYSTSRYRLLHGLRDLPDPLQRSLILEITDLEEGLPQSRLAELVSTVAPYCRAVLARAPNEHCDVSGWRRSGLGGVTLDCAHLDPGDRNVQFRLARFVRGALEVSRACVGYGLRSNSLLLTAWASGFTHLNGPAISALVGDLAAVRLEPAEVFAGETRRSAA